MKYLVLTLLGAALCSLGCCAGGSDSSSCGAAGQTPCDNGLTNTTCNNGTYYQKFYSYDSNPADLYGALVYRGLCLPMPNGTYTVGGPCDPRSSYGAPSDHACMPNEADGSTPYNQTVRCNWVQDNKKPGNDSYDKLVQDPYAYDSAVAASVGECVEFPADRCGQAYGPCRAVQIGSTNGKGYQPPPVYQDCPDSTGCPSGYYCEGIIGASKVGYPSATCLKIDPDCGKEVGGPCCPSQDPKAPHCPGDNLYCQVRGWMAASINDTYCLEIGACGHLGQPVCNQTVAGSPLGDAPGFYVNSEKDAQADVGGLRCELGLYDTNVTVGTRALSNGTCAANPADCGTLGKVACALPLFFTDDYSSYYLTCDKGLYVPTGSLSTYYAPAVNWWTTSTYNVTMPANDPSLPYPGPQMMRGLVDATKTCQECPQGNATYEFACKFGVPDGVRPTAGQKAVAKPVVRPTARTINASCSNAGQPPCTDEGYHKCKNGTYSQIFHSYGDPSDENFRRLCLPMPNGTYTLGGPCDPNDNKGCTRADKFGRAPKNQTLRCGYTSMLTSRKPGNESYDRLLKNPYANDSDVDAWVGTCLEFPASECGQAYGPCSSAQIGSSTANGPPGDTYEECPYGTRCPSGYYCEGVTGAKRLGYPWAICLKIDPDCGTKVDGPCCPGDKPDAPHCPAENLYCQVRGYYEAYINETYCHEIGGCGHDGQPICNFTLPGRGAHTIVDSEKNAQAYVADRRRCVLGAYNNMDQINGPQKCTANPPDCGTLGKVACAVPKKGDWSDYILTCDKGLYVPQGKLAGYEPYNITTSDPRSSINFTLPEIDPSLGPASLMTGFMNATMTCQKCPKGDPEYDGACNFGVPEGVRPKAGSAST